MEQQHKPGMVPRDMLPATKPSVAIVFLELAWIWADGIDWDKVAMGALALLATYLAPEWNPPRSAANRIRSRLRPGDDVGPATRNGPARFVVTDRQPPT